MQTECIPDIFGFKGVEGRQVVAAFDVGATDAGRCACEAQGHPRGRAGDLRRGMQADIANLFQRGELFAG